MFLAWLTVQQKCTVLLDPISGSVIPAGSSVGGAVSPDSAEDRERHQQEALLHSILLLAVGPGNDAVADPGSSKAYQEVSSFTGKAYRGTASYHRLCEIFAPEQDATQASLYMRLLTLRPSDGKDVVAVCDQLLGELRELLRKIGSYPEGHRDPDSGLPETLLSALVLRNLPPGFETFKELAFLKMQGTSGEGGMRFSQLLDDFRSTAVRQKSEQQDSQAVVAFMTQGKQSAGAKASNATRQCHNCNGIGHIAPDCPKPKAFCTKCKSPGHLAAHCEAVQLIKAKRAANTGAGAPKVQFMTMCAPAACAPEQAQSQGSGLAAYLTSGDSDVCCGAYYLDSCASHHMTNALQHFVGMPMPNLDGSAGVLGATGGACPSFGEGTVEVDFLSACGAPVSVQLNRVTYCPGLMASLVSAPQLMAHGHTVLENFSGVRTVDGRVLQLRTDARGFPYFATAPGVAVLGRSGRVTMLSATTPEQVQDFFRVAGGYGAADSSLQPPVPDGAPSIMELEAAYALQQSSASAGASRSPAVPSVDSSTQTVLPRSAIDTVAAQEQKMLQHRALAHLHEGGMNLIATNGLATGMNIDATVSLGVCVPCQVGKSTRVPLKAGGPGGPPGPQQNVPTSTYVPKRVAARTESRHFADMWGPATPKSVHGGYSQLLGVMESQTGVMCIIPQRDKTKVAQGLQWYHANVMPFERLRTDNDQVFRSEVLKDWCAAVGVEFTHSAPYTPEQMGAIERQWRTLEDAVATLLADSGLPGEFWLLAAQYSVYVRNRCPRASNPGGVSPYQAYTSSVPDVSSLHPFGCKAFLHVPKERRASKLHAKAVEGIFVGVQTDSNTFKVWVPASMDSPGAAGRLYESRDVRFDDSWTCRAATGATVQVVEAEVGDVFPVEPPQQHLEDPLRQLVQADTVGAQEERALVDGGESEALVLIQDEEQPPVQEEQPQVQEEQLPPVQVAAGQPQELRRSSRLRDAKPPDREWFKVTGRTDTTGAGVSATAGRVSYFESDGEDDEEADGGSQDMQTDGEGRVAFFTSMLESAQAAFFTGKDAPVPRLQNPKSVADALSGDPDKVERWRQSRSREFNSLLNRGVYEVVDAAEVPPGATRLRLLEIFKYKYDKAGVPTEKTRAVCLGNRQVAGRDYGETYAPVARFTTIRLLCSIAAAKGWELRQFDVETAFLYAPLEEENLYVVPPDDFRVGSDGQAVLWHLKKSLYGLKQAPKNWYGTFTAFLVDECGFTKSEHDPCLLMAYDSVGALDCAIAVYVDDVPAGVANPEFYSDFIVKVKSKFNLTEGPLEWCLGIEIDQSPGRVELRQTQYIETILERFQHQDCHATALPLDPGYKWSTEDSPKNSSEKLQAEADFEFRNFHGSVLYLAVATRPDLAYPCSKMGHVQSKHGLVHNTHAQQLLRYLQGTKHLGLVYSGGLSNANVLEGYVDASYADCPDTRRSTTGFCFMLNGAAVSWFSKKQTTVAQSSTESEYISTAPAACEAVSLRAVANELCIEQLDATVLHEDNFGCVQLTKDEVLHKKTKHVAVKYHKIRELVRNKVVRIQQVATDKQVADILTKLMSKPKTLEYLRSRILGYSPLSQ